MIPSERNPVVTPAPLVLHPLGLDASHCRGLSESWRSIDLPGHGGTPSPDSLDLVTIASAIAKDMADHTPLAGISVGGMLALSIALNHPEKVSSLALVATMARGGPVFSDRAERWRHEGRASLDADTLERWFGDHGTPKQRESALESLTRLDRRLVAGYWEAVARFDVSDRLSEIDVPVTCIAANDDISAQPAAVQTLAEGIADARFVTVPGPHLSLITHPVELAAALDEHLVAAGPPPAPQTTT